MKKVLILAYDFPPYVSVGGLRPYAWFKHFKEYGIEPVVITRQWENKHGNHLDYIEASASKETVFEKTEQGIILRAPYFPSLSNRILLKHGETKFRFVRKALTMFDEVRQFIIPSGPKSTLYKTAKEYLKANKVDAIIATGEPFVLFSFASRLSKQFNTPWIADYRDPWSQSIDRQKSVFKYLNPIFEKNILKSVFFITTVSEFFKHKISELSPIDTSIYLFPNGFDEENFKNVKNTPQSEEALQISFVGTIYNWHPWKSVIGVFSTWLEQHPETPVYFHFYGVNQELAVRKFIKNNAPNLIDYVVYYHKLPNSELIQYLLKSNAVLLFNDYSILGTKIYDYLAIQRKILLCYENDKNALKLKKEEFKIQESQSFSSRLQAEVIEATNSGVVVQDEVHLVQVLNELYAEFLKTGTIQCDSVGVENYSRKLQVGKLAELIHQIVH